MAFKIDLAKTYHIVDWRFLRDTLIAFSFLDRTIKPIIYASKASFSIMWNGEKLPKFKQFEVYVKVNPFHLICLCCA